MLKGEPICDPCPLKKGLWAGKQKLKVADAVLPLPRRCPGLTSVRVMEQLRAALPCLARVSLRE